MEKATSSSGFVWLLFFSWDVLPPHQIPENEIRSEKAWNTLQENKCNLNECKA